jgi:DNA-binding CsgD family transcriptional regulator
MAYSSSPAGFDYRRILIRPYGLARSPWEPLAAGGFALGLLAVFVLEMATPDEVVGVLGLLPLLAALWTLSNRLAVVISAIALIAFLLSTLEEPQSRITFLCVGAAGLATAVAVRAYATSLAELISSRRGLGLRTVEVESAGVIAGLTRRQLEVARLASQGYMAAEIGNLLHISERTVESHLAHAYSKLGINSRPALIRISERLREGARS